MQLASSTSGATTYTTSTALTTGLAYQFIVYAANNFGVGPASSPLTVYAAISPSGISAPTTTLDGTSSYVTVSWTLADNGGITPTYAIQILNSATVWQTVTESTDCSESASDIVALSQCTMSVSTLQSTYGLSTGSVVVAKVTATTAVGSVTSAYAGTAVMP